MKQQEYINLLKEEYGEYKCIMASLELENVEQTYPNMNNDDLPERINDPDQYLNTRQH